MSMSKTVAGRLSTDRGEGFVAIRSLQGKSNRHDLYLDLVAIAIAQLSLSI